MKLTIVLKIFNENFHNYFNDHFHFYTKYVQIIYHHLQNCKFLKNLEIQFSKYRHLLNIEINLHLKSDVYFHILSFFLSKMFELKEQSTFLFFFQKLIHYLYCYILINRVLCYWKNKYLEQIYSKFFSFFKEWFSIIRFKILLIDAFIHYFLYSEYCLLYPLFQ